MGQRMVCWRKRASSLIAMFVMQSSGGSKAGQEGTVIDKIYVNLLLLVMSTTLITVL